MGPQPTPKPPKTKAPKPTKAPKVKPTKPPKTKKPKPTKPVKTAKPTKAPKTKAPKPTEGQTGWGTASPLMENEREEMMAVDVNGTMETTFTGYSMQTEIAGLVLIVAALAIVGYSMMCKKDKNAEYVAIEDPKSAQPIA